MPTPSLKKRFNTRRVLGFALAAVFIVTVTLVLSLTLRVTRGLSRTVQTAEYPIRLEILNGCSKAGIANMTSGYLSGWADDVIEIVVVAIGDFDVRDVEKSFVISRYEDTRAAEHLADLLGIDRAEVVFNPLANNYRQVSATLVIGEDFDVELLSELSNKE